MHVKSCNYSFLMETRKQINLPTIIVQKIVHFVINFSKIPTFLYQPFYHPILPKKVCVNLLI